MKLPWGAIIMHEEKNLEIPKVEDKTVTQLIVFRAGHEEFGVLIDAVREIIKIGLVTPIPGSPDFIKGIINVRGEIVTAIDIKSRFSLPAMEETEEKHIVVTKKEDNLFGLIVDEVIEVLRIQQKDIKSAPSLLDRINEKYVKVIITHDERIIIFLDLDQVLSHDELIHLSHLKKDQMLSRKNNLKKGDSKTQSHNHQK
jgi:purine-binding chemotaxis protein CheW